MKRLVYVMTAMLALLSLANAQTFHKTKMIDPKGKEVPVEVEFDTTKQSLGVKTLGQPLVDVPYSTIEKLSYERASRRRVKEGALVMIGSLGVGGIVMLTKSKNHWFYVDYKQPDGTAKTLTLKLDKNEYERVLKIATEQTGKEVETLEPLKEQPKDKKSK